MRSIEEFLQTLTEPLGGGTHYYELLTSDENGLVVRLYGIRYRNCDKEPKVKLCFEERENGERFVNSDFYFTQMGGYNIVWERKRTSYYGECVPMDEMYDTTANYPNIGRIETLWDYNDLVYNLPEAKYLTQYPEGNIMKFIRIWRKHPEVEMIYKNKQLQWLWSDTRIYDIKDKGRFLNLVKGGLSVNDALGMMKYGSKEKMLAERKTNIAARKLKGLRVKREYLSEIPHYLGKGNYKWSDYRDYLELSKEFGRDINDRGVLFPQNLMTQHDNLVELKREKMEREKELERRKERRSQRAKARYFDKKNAGVFNEIIKEFTKCINKANKKSQDLKLVIPNSKLQFVDIGNELHNCVGVNGYDKKMIDRKCLIVAVYLNDKPVECCELKPTKTAFKIEQLRGDHNQDSEYHDNAKILVNEFIKNCRQANARA